MKATRKLIPAIAMLLISAVLMSTASYAWFSMNTQVTAKGMEVKAKADQVFLQIVPTGTTFSNTEVQNEATAVSSSATIAASNVVKANAGTTVTAFDGTAPVVWVKNHSDDPAKSAKVGDYITIAPGTNDEGLADYALVNTFNVRLNPSTGVTTAADPLKVTGVVFDAATLAIDDPMRNAVSVLIVCGEKAQLFKQANPEVANAGTVGAGTFAEVGTNTLTAAAFTNPTAPDPEYVEVKVYVFFDGENNSAYTNNVESDGYSVDLTFSVDY